MEKLTYNKALGLMAQLANKIACFKQYDIHWGADFCKSQAVELFDRQSEKYIIDPRDFTLSELKSLGAGKWSDDSSLVLFPLWITPFLPDGLEVESIDGEKSIIGKDEIDNDIRFGCVAYGINSVATD